MEPYKIIKRDEIYNGMIVDIIVDEVELPNGKTARREVVLHRREGVGILPVDHDGGIFLVRQYRHPLRAFVLEIPAGIMDAGEAPEACAARELEEEIGYRAGRVDFAVAGNNTVGVSNDKIHIYIASELVKTAQKLDPDEFLTVEKFSLRQCLEMIACGEIIDSKTILAIYAYTLAKHE